jgi:hypothetical protein
LKTALEDDPDKETSTHILVGNNVLLAFKCILSLGYIDPFTKISHLN